MKKVLLILCGLMIVGGNISPAYAHTSHRSKTKISNKIKKNDKSSKMIGVASWYGKGLSGRRTASGTRFNPNELTAAHKSLPLGTRVLVTNLSNGRETLLKITDRGPYSGRRILDVSHKAAEKLGMIKTGTARIKIKVIGDKLPIEVAEYKSKNE
mgnify:CR=1 FL=1